MQRSPRTSRFVSIFLIAAFGFMAAFLVPAPVSGNSPSEIAAAYIQKGDDLTLQKEYFGALEAYEAAVASDPYNSIAWNKLGIAHMNTGRYQDAVTAFEKAITIDPSFPEAWNNKGDSFAKLGEYEEAVIAYDQALRLNPNDLYALLRKGASLQESGSPDEALRIYQVVIDLAEKEVRKHPDYARFDAKLWSNKGEALYRLGRYAEAMDAYSTALSINPKYERAVQGMNHAEEEILRARGSPTNPVPVTEGSRVAIGLTNVPLPFPVLIGVLTAAIFLFRVRPQKK
ncbi:MAG: tetratricopeptide repeat protein [Methanoregula sp.]|nr:tetratricopeptide repeat protein [Methanoregula sp.]